MEIVEMISFSGVPVFAPTISLALTAQGIGVRCFGNSAGLDNCIRISMGTREENDAVFAAIKAFAESEGQK